MGQLEDMQLFIRVVEAGGIGRAAEQLGIAKSAVSRRLKELEQRLGCQLIKRTTRSASLSENGQSYYQQALKAVEYIDEINHSVVQSNSDLTGTLRIAVPLSFGLLHLPEVIDAFVQQHPEVKVQMDFSDRHTALVEEGFDLAIRIAELKDSGYQARRLAPIHHAIVASPDYLARFGEPIEPQQLSEHKILLYGTSHNSSWQIEDSTGEMQTVQLNSKMAANNGDFLLKMAIAGHGIVILPSFLLWQAQASGELVRILANCHVPSINAYAIYPQNRFLPRRARAFIDFVADYFGDTPYWDLAAE